MQEYRDSHKEKANEYNKQYRESNMEKNKEYQKEYRLKKKLEKLII